MAPPIRTSEPELKIARLLPVDEQFNLHSGLFPLGVARVSIMLKGFLCVTKKHEKNKSWYYISSEDKPRLIDCIKQNPYSKEFDITLKDGLQDDLWHKLLGTKQGVKHD